MEIFNNNMFKCCKNIFKLNYFRRLNKNKNIPNKTPTIYKKKRNSLLIITKLHIFFALIFSVPLHGWKVDILN